MSQQEIDLLSARLHTLENSLRRSRRRNRFLTGLGLAGGLLTWAGAALSAPNKPLACGHGSLLYCFGAGEPAVAEQVNSNFEALARNVDESVATRLPLSGGTMTGPVTMQGTTAIQGGNAQGNLHFDANSSGADGRIYLNWNSGKGVTIANGAKSAFATFDSSTSKATINKRRVPSEIVSKACSSASCTASCPTGTTVKLGFGMHGLSPSGISGDWACGGAFQWLGSCIDLTSCSITTACSSSGVWLECW